ncbi:MAG: hypothetical protein GYB17_17945 [Gammaproteobacteria bacterium]|nr:hypothetical protein [Gammaproteobacteria bacterium]
MLTNNVTDSSTVVEVDVLTFDRLWSAYPSGIDHITPDTGEEIFSNRCAVHVSEALYRCGVKLASFRGTRCWSCPTPEGGKGIHAIRAQELADYLNRRPFAQCPQAQTLTGEEFEDAIWGRTGIVFFKDYWRRGNQQARTGDHIDLWDGNELASIGAIETFLRLRFPNAAEWVGTSDLTKSSEVLFWELK